MKVCLLNDSFPPMIDGVVNVVMNYADYLMADHDAQVMVGTPRYPDTDYSSYPYPVVAYQSFDTTAVASGYRAGNPFVGKAVSSMAEFAPDIIHAHSPVSAAMMARILREETGAPVVFTYHTKFDIDIERVIKVKAIASEAIKVLVSNVEACDDIWVVSKGAGENLRSLGYEGEYHVMNNGVDFAKGRASQEEVETACCGYDLPEDVPVYLFVGRLMTYKGLPLILDALHILDGSGQDFRMVFVGKGPDRELLEKKAWELGLMGRPDRNDKVIFTGPVYDRNVLRGWNTRADLFLFPSTFDTNGLVVREAAACGLASVLIKDSCAAEGITDGHNGFIIEESAQSLAALLKEVSGNLPRLYDVGQHAMDEIYLSWQSCVSDAYERYQWLLEEKSAGRLRPRDRVLSDYLIGMTAKGIEHTDEARQYISGQQAEVRQYLSDQQAEIRGYVQAQQDEFRHERDRLLDLGRARMLGFKESAMGMMENILEAEEDAGEEAEQILSQLRQNIDEIRARSEKRKNDFLDMFYK